MSWQRITDLSSSVGESDSEVEISVGTACVYPQVPEDGRKYITRNYHTRHYKGIPYIYNTVPQPTSIKARNVLKSEI